MARLPYQHGVLAPAPQAARFVSLSLSPGADPKRVLSALMDMKHDPQVLVGLGAGLLGKHQDTVPGYRPFSAVLPLIPATQADLWLRLSHKDETKRHDVAAGWMGAMSPWLDVQEEVPAFTYRGGRDLSGYKDGSANPVGTAAAAAALLRGSGKGLDGGSFALVQRWVHDLPALDAMAPDTRDAVMGRRQRSDKEIPEAPRSAHVKRVDQESYAPHAFMVRRSMPYGDWHHQGLYFVAFMASLERAERMLQRMAGREDGIVDAVFSFSFAVASSFYFCPPIKGGRYDLRAVSKD